MARILFLLPRFHTNLWFATRAMLSAGHSVQLMVNGASRGEDHSLLQPVVMGRNPAFVEVDAAIRHFAPDLVFVRNAWGLSRRGSQVARRRGIPRLLYNQRPYDRPTPALRRILLRLKDLPVERITPVRGLGPGADPWARYLPWPVAALEGEAPPPAPDGRLRVLVVGKLGTARKNQTLLIETLERAGLQDRLHLTLVGAGRATLESEGHARAVAEAAQRRERWVRLLQHVPFARMPALYRAADLCILPSFAEPLGTAPVEGMAYGAVPMISREAGSAGYLDHGRDGFVIDMRKPETLIEPLRILLADPGRLRVMKAAARRTAETELGEARFLERLHAILQAAGAPAAPEKGEAPVTAPKR